MKNFINRIKDFFYNLTDYILILVVILIVGGILIWRFDALFDLKVDKNDISHAGIESNKDKNDTNKDNTNNQSTSTQNTDNKQDENIDNTDQNDKKDDTTAQNPDGSQNETVDNNKDSNTDNADDSKTEQQNTEIKDVTISIPAGAFPSKIADILLQKNLIKDKNEFLTRCVELKLDTKLKSGDFTFKSNANLDDIIKTIAKVK